MSLAITPELNRCFGSRSGLVYKLGQMAHLIQVFRARLLSSRKASLAIRTTQDSQHFPGSRSCREVSLDDG